MQPESRKLLMDMQESSNSIAEFVAGKTLQDFKEDKLLRSGVNYCFLIIGEALSRLRQSDAASAQRISESARIIGFRNQLIHGYAKIEEEITWRIIDDKLPILRRELEQLLRE